MRLNNITTQICWITVLWLQPPIYVAEIQQKSFAVWAPCPVSPLGPGGQTWPTTRRQISIRNKGFDGCNYSYTHGSGQTWLDFLPSCPLLSFLIFIFYLLLFLQPSSLLSVPVHVLYSERMAQDHPSLSLHLALFHPLPLCWIDNCLHCAQEGSVPSKIYTTERICVCTCLSVWVSEQRMGGLFECKREED